MADGGPGPSRDHHRSARRVVLSFLPLARKLAQSLWVVLGLDDLLGLAVAVVGVSRQSQGKERRKGTWCCSMHTTSLHYQNTQSIFPLLPSLPASFPSSLSGTSRTFPLSWAKMSSTPFWTGSTNSPSRSFTWASVQGARKAPPWRRCRHSRRLR